MANVTKLPVAQKPGELVGDVWRPFEALRKEVDRLFDEVGDDYWRRPAALEWNWPKKFATAPAVDIAETDKSYEITTELPGMDEKGTSR